VRSNNGIAAGYLNSLAGTVTGPNTVSIDTGGAVVDGKWYKNDSAKIVNIPSAVGGGNTRIDRIVLRTAWSDFKVEITRIAGTDAANPVSPAIIQNSGTVYDIPLYQAVVNTSGTVTLIDERQFGQVPTNGLADDAVTPDKLADDAVTPDKLDDDGDFTVKSLAAIQSGPSAFGYKSKVAGDSVDRFIVQADGAFAWGPGNAARDTNLYRSAANVLKTDDSLDVGGNIAVAGTVDGIDVANHDHTGGSAGTPIPTGGIADGAVTTAKIADGAVTTAKIAADAVDDTKVGNRVPQFYRRQGGDASDWSVAGTTSRTPGAVRMQAGSAIFSSNGAFKDITMPVAFSNYPLPFCSQAVGSLGNNYYASINVVSDGTFQKIRIFLDRDPGVEIVEVRWFAIGPE
jgi:hypothetical protein